jgi:N utilization substance protein B
VAVGRRRARREALFLLYQRDLMGITARVTIERAEHSGMVVDSYTRLLVLGVEDQLEDLDRVIGRHLQGWTVGRLAALERNILRIGLFEMWLRRAAGPSAGDSVAAAAVPAEDADDVVVPPEVAIDQAVELAKRYCSDEAGALINGVLGAALAAGET